MGDDCLRVDLWQQKRETQIRSLEGLAVAAPISRRVASRERGADVAPAGTQPARRPGRKLAAGIAIALTVFPLATGASALDPQSFADVSSGVVFIRATGCAGGAIHSGSGFLIGNSVVMTAYHVVRGCRAVRVLVKERKWVDMARFIYWKDGGRSLDVATLKLAEPLEDVWAFSLRPGQVPIGAYVAALGHPLGEAVSYTNGRVLRRGGQYLLLRILSAQGYSGGPIVDSYGRVVGIVNIEITGRDPGFITGAYTADNIIAYDLSSRWGGWRRTLCHAYPYGGIQDCG
jgi:S1-C subfamily serine protease